jgi:hypothetical protein
MNKNDRCACIVRKNLKIWRCFDLNGSPQNFRDENTKEIQTLKNVFVLLRP